MNLVNKIPEFVEVAVQKLTELEGQDKLFQARFDNLVTGIKVDRYAEHSVRSEDFCSWRILW